MYDQTRTPDSVEIRLDHTVKYAAIRLKARAHSSSAAREDKY